MGEITVLSFHNSVLTVLPLSNSIVFTLYASVQRFNLIHRLTKPIRKKKYLTDTFRRVYPVSWVLSSVTIYLHSCHSLSLSLSLSPLHSSDLPLPWLKQIRPKTLYVSFHHFSSKPTSCNTGIRAWSTSSLSIAHFFDFKFHCHPFFFLRLGLFASRFESFFFQIGFAPWFDFI